VDFEVDDRSYSELYSAYAAGTLDPAFALLVETQASLRSDIASDLRAGEMIAGALLDIEMPAALREDALKRAIAAVDWLETAGQPSAKAVRQASEALDELTALPDPLREQALLAAGGRAWQRTSRGIRRLKLETGGIAEAELYRIEPGAAVPRHSHGGAELSLVVQGGFSDETGSFGPGDLAIQGPDVTHQPIGDEDGICIVLAVRDSGLRFTGAMGLIQRLLWR
jgi:putative transcriptional regulator